MRNQFWGQLHSLQEHYSKKHNGAHISYEFILAANIVSEGFVDRLESVSSSPQEYYEDKGYVLGEDGCYTKPTKPSVKLRIEGNVVIKEYADVLLVEEVALGGDSYYRPCT